MIRWHQTLAAQWGLRFGGMLALSLAWLVGSYLYARVHSHPPAQATFAELGLCTILVVLLVVGNGLLFVGPNLWRTVPLPGQWSAAQIDAFKFEVLLDRDRSSLNGPARPHAKTGCLITDAMNASVESIPSKNEGAWPEVRHEVGSFSIS